MENMHDTPPRRKLTELEKRLIGIEVKMEDIPCKAERERVTTLEHSMIGMKGDVTHIKDRLDNGISETLKGIENKLNNVIPLVNDNAYWTKAIKQGLVRIAIFSLTGGIITLLFFAVKGFIMRILNGTG